MKLLTVFVIFSCGIVVSGRLRCHSCSFSGSGDSTTDLCINNPEKVAQVKVVTCGLGDYCGTVKRWSGAYARILSFTRMCLKTSINECVEEPLNKRNTCTTTCNDGDFCNGVVPKGSWLPPSSSLTSPQPSNVNNRSSHDTDNNSNKEKNKWNSDWDSIPESSATRNMTINFYCIAILVLLYTCIQG